jgi:hypothetical protein
VRLVHGLGACALLLSSVSARPHAAQGSQADIPDGPGKAVLLSACTACHELKEITKFRGFYTKDEWRDIVVTMVKYGAVVKDDEVTVLVDYLFKNFGKKD